MREIYTISLRCFLVPQVGTANDQFNVHLILFYELLVVVIKPDGL